MRSAIILAGGPSRRLGRPKALVRIRGVPLVVRVVRAAAQSVSDVVVVTREALAPEIKSVAPPGARVVLDRRREQSPLVGLLAGARAARGEYALALGCDQPFLSPPLLNALLSRARGCEGAIPRWPNGMIEPLLAAYRVTAVQRAAEAALREGLRSNQSMIDRMRDVRFVPVAAFRRLDPSMRSFVNVNTPADLARARRM